MLRTAVLFAIQLAAAVVDGSALPRSSPFEHLIDKRQPSASTSLEVDLGYDLYQGVSNATTGLNTWKGIRFAAPPTGSLRWQSPKPPAMGRTEAIQATSYASQCPQSPGSGGLGGVSDLIASEDCLFLNVYAPPNAQNLPVLVWIHGGGYGVGNGRQDLSAIINANNNSFVGVAIQYRLGAFGFLAGDEVFRNGVVNAGILDQTFALQWVQSYIGLFGGNSSMVTISGESAGGGSVMLQTMAYGGSLGESLFTNIISASPYLPMQYGYKDWVPSQSYYAFAAEAGCLQTTAYGSSPATIFECLTLQDTMVLQNASYNVSSSGTHGTWGFLPVTDGIFIQDVPSHQLLQKRLNGRNLLVGNNANEGPLFVPPNITTEDDLLAWLHLTFPLMADDDLAKILLYYPSSNASDNPNASDYATLGYTGPTALNESSVATGQQQRANNVYAETTFICPSYWMAESFSADAGRSAYKYQYSVPAAQHGSDVTAYFGPRAPNQGPDLVKAFMTIWGNFVTASDPSLSAEIANGARANDDASSSSSTSAAAAADWAPFSVYAPYQLNLNQSGGVPFSTEVVPGVNATEDQDPGLANDFSLVNAWTWEAGRGYRCDFWRSVAALVPE